MQVVDRCMHGSLFVAGTLQHMVIDWAYPGCTSAQCRCCFQRSAAKDFYCWLLCLTFWSVRRPLPFIGINFPIFPPFSPYNHALCCHLSGPPCVHQAFGSTFSSLLPCLCWSQLGPKKIMKSSVSAMRSCSLKVPIPPSMTSLVYRLLPPGTRSPRLSARSLGPFTLTR